MPEGLFAFGSGGVMSTNSWSIDADGDWSVAGDWSLKHAPSASDDVVINTADAHTVTYSTGAATVNSLTVGNDNFTLSGGSLTASAASFAQLLTITGGALGFGAANVSVGGLTQSGGTLSGTGVVTVSGATAFAYVYPSVAIETGTGKTVLQGTTSLKSYELGLDGGRVLENQGTLTWSQGEIRLGYGGASSTGGATIQNDAGATFNIQSASIITNELGSTSFTNAGLVEQTLTKSTTDIQTPFINSGTVSVKTGTLEFDGGGSSAPGAFTVASGATLAFGGVGTFTLGAGTLNTGPGALSVTNGDLVLGGALTANIATVSGGTLALGANTATIASFTQGGFGAAVSGSGTMTVTGTASFGSGYFTQAGKGVTVLQGASTYDNLYGLDDPYGFYLDGGRVLENQGVFTWSAGNFELGLNPSGFGSVGATIQNDAKATFDIATDANVVRHNGTTAFTNAGALEKTITTGITAIGVNFTNTGTMAIQTGTLALTGPQSTIGGSVTGAGTLSFASGAQTITGATAVSVATWALSGGAATSVNQALTYGGAFSMAAGTTLAMGAGDTFTLTGAASLAGAIAGPGTLALSADKATVSGSVAIGANLSLTNAATLTVAGAVTSSGAVNTTAGTTISIGAGQSLGLSGGGTVLAGTFLGAGALSFTGGSQAIDKGAILGVSNWSILAGATSLNTSLTYKGHFSQAGSAALSVASGDILTLAGPATSLSGTFEGLGKIKTAKATVSNFLLGGKVQFTDQGTITQTGQATIGDATSAAALVYILAGDTWRITNDSGLARGTASGSAIHNAGLFEKSGGTGVSVIGVKIVNTGQVEAASGVLDLAQFISGTGTLAIDTSAALEADAAVAATQTVSFKGGAAQLILRAPGSFDATIAGFAVTDTIDLANIKNGVVSLGSGGVLTVGKGGKTLATLHFTGDYTGETFTTAADGHGGTLISLTPGGGAAAKPSAFAAQIAAFATPGVGAGGSFDAVDMATSATALTAIPHGFNAR